MEGLPVILYLSENIESVTADMLQPFVLPHRQTLKTVDPVVRHVRGRRQFRRRRGDFLIIPLLHRSSTRLAAAAGCTTSLFTSRTSQSWRVCSLESVLPRRGFHPVVPVCRNITRRARSARFSLSGSVTEVTTVPARQITTRGV